MSANHKVEEILKDIKKHKWPKQPVPIIKSLTGKRLLSFYVFNILNSLLITSGKPKVLGKMT